MGQGASTGDNAPRPIRTFRDLIIWQKAIQLAPKSQKKLVKQQVQALTAAGATAGSSG